MPKQYPLPLPHTTAMEADDFMVTASNREAATSVNIWPDWPSHCLMIIGPAGSGKTHLLNLWLQKSHGTIIQATDLMVEDAGNLFENNNIIAIDDIEKIAGEDKAEVTLFHLYNLLRETKGFLLLTASRPAAQWNIKLPDLRSRILASPVASIAAPDDELLTMLLVKQFNDRQVDISADVVAYLVPRMERTASAVRMLVADLDQASLAERKPVTMALVKKVLKI